MESTVVGGEGAESPPDDSLLLNAAPDEAPCCPDVDAAPPHARAPRSLGSPPRCVVATSRVTGVGCGARAWREGTWWPQEPDLTAAPERRGVCTHGARAREPARLPARRGPHSW